MTHETNLLLKEIADLKKEINKYNIKTTYVCSGCGRESTDLIKINKVKDVLYKHFQDKCNCTSYAVCNATILKELFGDEK